MSTPSDICRQSLDAIGSETVLGDIEDGSRQSQVCLRAYTQALRQIFRSAHWDCLRRQAPLTLLADSTGQTPDVGTLVPLPWTYEYSYPTDCVKIRFIPWNNYQANSCIPPGNIATPANVPVVANAGQPPLYAMRIRPARFIVGSDPNYPPPGGSQTWDTPGVSPIARTVVCTNVKCAVAIYTAYLPYPNLWDALLREAIVAYIAAQVALPLSKDKKFGLTLRGQQIMIAKEKISQARISDGNEGFYSSDIPVDWMRTRMTGGSGTGWGNEGAFGGGDAGVLGYGWDSCSMADGSAY